MLNLDHMHIGSSIELPEIATHLSNKSSRFIVKGIFAGGMGVCIRLFHPETNKEFALKGIRPEFISEQVTVDRFLDELKVWVAASSCNLIAEALAVVRLNGSPYVLATWMPNGDLSHSLPHLTKTKKIEALLRIIRGLSWVKNNLGVIHRDLKPSNIFLDKDGLAYVADWGLARPIGHALHSVGKTMANIVNRPDRTQQGSFIGTVTYAAPEQIMGLAAIDHRTDIYAIGCMMFEFETGAPPFLGKTVFDIANQHLREKPKKLGGWFSSTDLGLEHIIARCLEKNPKDRYQSYEQLESDLLPIAKKQGVALQRCEQGTRYKRTVLGQGEKQQMDMLMNDPKIIRGKNGYMVADMSDLLPFLIEADSLIALERYAEAEKIYRPHVLPEMLEKWTGWWGLPHDAAANYGLCLDRLGRALEAEKIFLVLAKNGLKPAVFYVNYSLTLNILKKSRQATDLCREGLKYFPNDIDIQGNLTIALLQVGEYEHAFDSALKRLKIRRDVHSLDEAADVLFEYATAIRCTDLPRAIELAKTMGDLIKEGLHLNPNYHILRMKEVLLRSLIQDAEAVNTIAPALWGSELVPLDIRKYALIQMLEHWADNGWGSDAKADAVLQFIKTHPGWLSVTPKLKEIELRTIARYQMMRGKGKAGERVISPEIGDYFLNKKSSGSFPDPILAAQLKYWLGETKEALEILATYLADVPDDFNGIRLMAMLHASSGNFTEGMKYGQLLVEIAPWRAESYDCLAFVAGQAGDANLEKQAKIKGDKVFPEEARLYEEAKAYLNRK
ncbi:Serine/threonine protein kinase [Giesbergeria anulus]|uniref:Serine/threonine protein kinase n=2 Tax=Giesbergeria anulus TaxID=180197 RepID=A0A1H9F7G6_9BURK|nr:Serine/threonine protein kinase [Giesbergeria anulus]